MTNKQTNTIPHIHITRNHSHNCRIYIYIYISHLILDRTIVVKDPIPLFSGAPYNYNFIQTSITDKT